MSLEQQIEKVAIGLNELVAILTEEAKARRTPAGPPLTADTKAPTPAPEAPAVEEPEPEVEEEITDEVMQKTTRDLLQKVGVDRTKELVTSFGKNVKKATDIPQAQRVKYLADAKTLLAGK